MGTNCQQPVDNGLTIEVWKAIDSKLTAYAHDVHWLINRADDLRMVQAWHSFGFKLPVGEVYKMIRIKDIRSMSALGCLCAMAWHYGRTQTPWLLALEQFARYANARPEEMKLPVIKDMPDSFKPEGYVPRRD